MKQYLALFMVLFALFFSVGTAACEYAGGCDKACRLGPYFITPQDGDVVSGDVHIKMGIKGMQVHQAGEIIEGTGHHHLIIDGAYIPGNTVVPKDATHIHFGKGQTETTVKLKPGKHTLTLQFADGHHQSYGKIMSRTISITVK
jgi:hypothetical protein